MKPDKVIKINNYLEVPNDFTGIAEYSNKLKQWYKEGKLHRENGPAVELERGQKEWWIEGKRHRTDGPAREYSNGEKEWWVDGKKFFEEIDITNKLSLKKEKGKYGLEWIKFLTEEGIEEFPIISGMNYRLIRIYSVNEYFSL